MTVGATGALRRAPIAPPPGLSRLLLEVRTVRQGDGHGREAGNLRGKASHEESIPDSRFRRNDADAVRLHCDALLRRATVGSRTPHHDWHLLGAL